MHPRYDRKSFVCALLDVVQTALSRKMLEDCGTVLAGVRILRPRMPDLDIAEAYLLCSCGRYREAVQLLRSIEDHPMHGPMARALIASCQRVLGEPEWRAAAQAVLAGEASETAREIARGALGLDRPDAAGANPAPALATPAEQPAYDMTYMFMRA